MNPAPEMRSQIEFKCENSSYNMSSAIFASELRELYIKKQFSCRAIGKLFGVDKHKISLLLKSYGINLRTKQEEGKLIKHPIKYNISKEYLENLYWNQKLSPYQIAEKYGCSPSCIFSKMERFEIPLRGLNEAINLSVPRRSATLSDVVTKYKKNDFSGTDMDKAYLLGFRLGDLNVDKNKYGKTIYVSSGTTKAEQINLMKTLFEKYGHINTYALKNGCTQFCCSLNMSFDFLLRKEDSIQTWMLSNNDNFTSFLAGYIDAEGHFGVYNNFAEFSIGSYDQNILTSIYQKLNEMDIYCAKPRLTVEKGYVDKRGVKNNGDLYRLRITRKNDLLKLVNLIKSRIKHAKRFADLVKAEENLLERNKSP